MEKDDKSSMIAGLYGNALEWYDFLLYASFAPVFANIFFPNSIYLVSIVATFSIFALSFFVRPFGGALIGHYADYAGRRRALILSITLMTFSTISTAFLPTFKQAGLVSPILLTLLRLIQGIAVGGELPSSAIFLIEHVLAHKRGFAGSLVLSTAFLGIFLGSFSASILSDFFSEEGLLQWGWRLAYLIGGLLGIIGIYLRVKSNESPTFLQVTRSVELPAKLIFTKYKKELFLAVMFTSIMALGNYILIAYVNSFLVEIEGFNLHDALIINFTSLLLLTIFIPLFGFFSDHIGYNILFLCGLGCLLVCIFPIFWSFTSHKLHYVLYGELLLALILAPINATIPALIVDIFPTDVRASGTSISYNIGQACFGGTAPLIAFTLIELTHNKLSPAWYVFILTGIVFFVTKWLHERNVYHGNS
jgi:proline/betaine transport protein TphA